MAVTNINPTGTTISAGMAIEYVAVVATGNWSATPNVAWILATSGTPGSGNGVLELSIDSNPGETRVGTVSIGSLTFTVTQIEDNDKGAIKL